MIGVGGLSAMWIQELCAVGLIHLKIKVYRIATCGDLRSEIRL